MKKRSRLTALLLALLLTFAAPVSALATTITYDDYTSAVQDVSDAVNAPEVPVEDEQHTTVTVYGSGESIERSVVEGVITEGEDNSFTLSIADKLVLSVAAAAETYQWQIRVEGVWANIVGENGASVTLTYAMLGNALTNGTAVVRCCLNGESFSPEALICVDTNVSVTNTEDADNVSVTTYYGAAPVNKARAMYMPAALSEDGDTTNVTYSVVINYVFENGGVAASPYTASLAAGTGLTTTVTHPTVQGYLPYVGEATETSTSIDLNITDIQADVTYTVTYRPTNVDYTVIHYQQNVDNDNYTQVAQETKQGLTNSTVPEVAKSYDGFYALLYEKPAIAADGSTVVEVYYDRYYYLMNFDLDGGYGVEPIYARYGAKIENVGEPTKAGYTFKGWSLDGAEAKLPETMPAESRTYKAIWEVNDSAKVKVVIWGENPNDEEYSYLTTGELMLTPNTEYTYNGTDTLYLYCDKEEHTHDASCLICGKTEHTQHTEACLGNCKHEHTLECYKAGYYELGETSKPDEITNYSADGIYTYTGRYGVRIHYYLYLGGKWYCAKEGYIGGGDTQEITLRCTHTHDESCYTCEIHAHTAACYGCGKEEHTHDSNCTGTVAGLDSTLWKFVRSDTVTVNPDGSSVINVYYDRTTFTMTFKETGNNGRTLDSITDKWGADIKGRFETISKANTFFWSASKNGGDPWTSFMDVMPAENRTYYADYQSGSSTITATYLGENLEGTGYETLYTVSFKGSSTIKVTKEEFVDIEGFTSNAGMSSKIGDYYNGSKFYYDRHHYSLEFYSPTALLKTETDVAYQSPLNSYEWTPDASQAPAKYEPGSVKFDGWYLNPECTGDKFDFTTHTMPAGTNDGDTTLTLYAKWVPVTHTVEFYLDKDDMTAEIKIGATHPDLIVPHGSKVKDEIEKPTNGSYTFIGWFYMDGDTEKAFDFANMPVNKDMKVYGKWSSNTLMEYTINYMIQGTTTKVADSIEGSGLAGITKTFDAKGGTDLYAGYQEGYFPVVKSHSLTIDIDNEANNTFTFWYVQKQSVPYTVKYLNKETGQPVADEKTVSDNRKAVVTETFVPVSGMMPDAYQKRLVVSVDEKGNPDTEHNVIIFYYTEDTTHAYYKITHYTQNTDGENWTEYASSQAVGDIGKPYSADPMTIPGFTYSRIEYKVGETVVTDITEEGAKLTSDGLEINLYYTRNSYPYVVRYLEQGTGKQLAAPKTTNEDGKPLTGLYGAVVSESAITIPNYTAVAPTSQTLNIKIENVKKDETGAEIMGEDGKPVYETNLNIITFYYEENTVTINYEVVGPTGCGTVTPTSETLKVLSGTAQGSTPTANDNFRFVGWYSDKDCTQTVDASWVDSNNKLTPHQPSHTQTDENGAPVVDDSGNPVLVTDLWQNATYYAKFDWNEADLTITKTGLDTYAYGGAEDQESAIFKVEATDKDGNLRTYWISLANGQSVTIKGLRVGSVYKITEQNDWTWRYNSVSELSGAIVRNSDGSGVTVNIANQASNPYWLGGDNYKVNVFGTN